MRRDLVVQVIVQYDDFWENFATPFEAESFINSNLDELDLPVMVRLEDMKGNVKWYYDLVEDEGGVYRPYNDIWITAGSAHARSFHDYSDEYAERVGRFVDKVLR